MSKNTYTGILYYIKKIYSYVLLVFSVYNKLYGIRCERNLARWYVLQ